MKNEILNALKEIVGDEHASSAESVLHLHGQDQSSHKRQLPDVVVWPENTAQVSSIVKYAAANQIAITGWGAGSSLEGNSIPVKGGIVINFGRMNKILKMHAGDFQVIVQPGIFYKDMNKELAKHGLFFPPDPGANASIGGMVANNAAGTRTVKYGATRDNVLALEVVLANGEVIRTGSRSIKQSAGYDLTHLIIGSEGTLALVTEATLKLSPLPEHFSAVLATFETADAAAQAVYGVMGSGVGPAALELLDAEAVRLMNTRMTDLPVKPTLLMEFHGATEASLVAELELVKEICEDGGCTHFEAGAGREARDRLWEGRHALGEILFSLHPDSVYQNSDVAVPISAFPILAAYANQKLVEMNLKGTLFGHAGDGNLHATVFAKKDDLVEQAKLEEFNSYIVKKAIDLDGTCTGEHGVGIGKQKYMVYEHGEGGVEAMRQVKKLFDPKNIFNPGKVVAFD